MNFYNFVKKNRKYFAAVLLIIVFILIGRFISTINFSELKKYLYEMPAMIGGVILASVLAYISSTLAWWLCLGKERAKTTFFELFAFKHVGEMLTIFNPTGIIAGDGLKAAYIFQKGIDKKEGLSSILLSRALIFLSGIFLLIISIIYLTTNKIGHDKTVLYLLVVVSIIGLLGISIARFMLHKNLYFGNFIRRLKSIRFFSFITDKMVTSGYEVNQLLSDYFRYNKTGFLAVFLLSAAQWLFGALEFFIVLQMLEIPIAYPDALAIEMGVIFFKTIGAIIPGQIGVEEYGNKIMLESIGVQSNEIWLVVTLMRRTRQLFWLGVAGIFVILISGNNQAKLYK